MGQGTNVVFNVVTILFVLLTTVVVAVVASVLLMGSEPPFWAPAADVATSTLAPTLAPQGIPTLTPSITPTETPTLEPTLTETPSPTASPTVLAIKSPTPSASPTTSPSPRPSATLPPTATFTPTPSPTFTITPTPTGPTPTPTVTLSTYPFTIQQGTPLLRDNFVNIGAGCNWQGVAGLVTDQTGAHLQGIEVHVSGDGFAEIAALSGTNPGYGASGWEVMLASAPNTGRYQVSLWSSTTQISPVVTIVFPGSCQQNLALINFVQTRPY
jgi:hypothetical protein